MAYEKQNFEDGQLLTAEALNHMEGGIEGAAAGALPGGSGDNQQLVTDSRGNVIWEDRSNGYFNYEWGVWTSEGWDASASVEKHTYTYTYSGEPEQDYAEDGTAVPDAAGEKYEVIVDGVSYFATSEMIYNLDLEPTGLYGVGNIGLYVPDEYEDNGMPFFFYQRYEGSTVYMMYIFRSAGTYEVAIKKRYISETFPIDNRLLPKAKYVADATGETPTATEFNALLASLRTAGYLR